MSPEQQQGNDPLEEIDVELDDQPKPRPMRTATGRHNRQNNKRIVWIAAAAALALALIGGAAYWWLAVRGEGSEEPAATQNQPQTTQPERETTNLSPQEAAEMVTYKNDTLNIEFKHRRDWTAKETNDKKGITLMSPSVGYQTQNGSVPDTQGVFTLHIRSGVNQATQETVNGAVAVRDSQVIAYAEPTEAQRYYTNVSYAGQDGHLQFFIVTGSTAYKTEDALTSTLPLTTADYFLIAGGFGEDADNTLAFDLVPASQIDSEVFKQAIAIVESLKIY